MQRGSIQGRGGLGRRGSGLSSRGGQQPPRNPEPERELDARAEVFGQDGNESDDEPRFLDDDELALYDYPRIPPPQSPPSAEDLRGCTRYPAERDYGEGIQRSCPIGIVRGRGYRLADLRDIMPPQRPSSPNPGHPDCSFGGRGRGGSRSQRGLLHNYGTRLPTEPQQTHGHSGKDIPLITNYFKVVMDKDWGLHQYVVDFNPPEDETFIRKAIIRSNQDFIGHRFLFDGGIITTPFLIEHADEKGVVTLDAVRRDGSVTAVTIRYLKHTEYGDPIYIQFYNLIIRKCMEALGLEEMGRGFFNPSKPINYPALNVQLWPGFLTAINHHDEDVLLNVEVTHKVLRTESVLALLSNMHKAYRGTEPFPAFVNRNLHDSVVMTTYNHETYRIVAIKYDTNPTATFKNRKGEDVSYASYYYSRYKKSITDMNQPLILALPTRRRQPAKGKSKEQEEENGEIFLIPEFCLFTGLTDEMRANNSLMRELAGHLHMGPYERIKVIQAFMADLIGTEGLTEELADWGLHFETDLEGCFGRVLPKEDIQFGNGIQTPNDQEDFTTAFRNKTLLAPKPLNKWMILVTNRDSAHVDNLVRTMQKVGHPLGVEIDRPIIIKIENPKVQSYVKAIDAHVAQIRKEIQMVFIVLGSNSPLVYGAIKKRLAVDFGVSSQCFLAKNLTSKGIMSIATKVVVQMTTKIGAEPWSVNIPTRGVMVVGYDTYNKVHAAVASLNANFTKFFSTVTTAETKLDVNQLSSDIEKCLIGYQQYNQALPKHIVVFRAGNISHDAGLEDAEVVEIQHTVKHFYDQDEADKQPWLTYMVVVKKTNTRLFKEEGFGNPPPGTVLDKTVTLKGKFQFFLISATARQGTVAPVGYHVIFNDGPLNADKLQLLTYKLCHMYFNWSGTVSVPAPVQYAHKLAQMASLAYEGLSAHPNLSDLLHYL